MIWFSTSVTVDCNNIVSNCLQFVKSTDKETILSLMWVNSMTLRVSKLLGMIVLPLTYRRITYDELQVGSCTCTIYNVANILNTTYSKCDSTQSKAWTWICNKKNNNKRLLQISCVYLIPLYMYIAYVYNIPGWVSFQISYRNW